MSEQAPRLVGAAVEVPLVGGRRAPYVNLDFAASAPALEAVRDAVEEFLPYYSSVHRGAGFKSQISTEAFEHARAAVAAFVGARDDDVVCFTTNTTGALNILAAALPEGTKVVAFGSEHHANMLPWLTKDATFLDTPATPAEVVATLEDTLSGLPAGPVLVSVTGASNVTGELWPVGRIAEVCRRHGARLAVDCAQLAPHAPISLAEWGADWVAFSGHKVYAPYGAGALVGRRDWLEAGEPFVRGGGAVTFVTLDTVMWAPAPQRQEAGSPNVVGAVALGVACRTLASYGMDRIAAEEAAFEAYVGERLAAIPGFTRYRLWEGPQPRIGVVSFNHDRLPYGLLAAALAAEHGIAVRDGCFCAHPLMLRLLGIDECKAQSIRAELIEGRHVHVPGAVRLSTGLSTTYADLDRALDALRSIAERGPQWSYRFCDDTGHYVPEPDDRPLPRLAVLRSPTAAAIGTE